MNRIPTSEIPDHLVSVIYGAEVCRAAAAGINQHVIIDPATAESSLITTPTNKYLFEGLPDPVSERIDGLTFVGVKRARSASRFAIRRLVQAPVDISTGDKVVLEDKEGTRIVTLPVTHDRSDIFEELGDD